MMRAPHLLDRIKQMEFQGYELEAAEGTFGCQSGSCDRD
jgi:hypothetical protein